MVSSVRAPNPKFSGVVLKKGVGNRYRWWCNTIDAIDRVYVIALFIGYMEF